MKKKIGFIGLGAMGKPMATNLLRKGYPVRVFDLVLKKDDEAYWRNLGGAIGRSSHDVSEHCEVVVTMLPTSENVRSAVLGNSGVIRGLRKGCVVIDMSTIDPSTTKEVAEALAAQGIEMLDAPVARSVKAAREGTLAIFVGGKREVFERCRDILEAMGTDIFHVGGIGNGEVVKIVNNLILAGTMSLLSEALVLGVKAGVRADALYEALAAGSANSFVLQHHVGSAVMKGAFQEGVFPVAYMLKDLGLALNLGDSLHVPLSFTALAAQFYQHAMASGEGNRYHPVVIRTLERLTGIEVRLGDPEESP
ncbi:MAG: NAD(P)-dependent oxidoreductase [Desulfobacterales bacterium]|nr:MAG: NAD(P)-dependent oxidoreductase [Desulfobacterales bacterium]